MRDVVPICLRLPPREIAYVKFLFESYEGVAVVRTLDRRAATLVVLAAPDFAAEAHAVVETLIAVTIIYMALENVIHAAMDKIGGDIARRWIIAFAFGIVHGFGFSFALRETLQFAGDHLLTALFGFNLGVEIGQLAALVVLIP